MEPEICTKMLKKLSSTTPGCSIAKIARLDDASLGVFLTESKPSRRSITTAKRKKKRKRKGERKYYKKRKA